MSYPKPDPDEPDPIHFAASVGDLATVRHFIEQGSSTESIATIGETLLHAAARRDQIEVARFLLEQGANIHAVRDGGGIVGGGATPLSLAAYSGSPEMVRLLLSYGADPTTGRYRGANAIEIADRFYALYPDPKEGYGEKLAIMQEHLRKQEERR